MSAFYEGYYLAQNPDVAKAVNAGLIGSGWEHYVKWGAAEGRSYAEPLLYDAFNELYYLAKYPDVATAVNAGIIGTGWDHYVQWGALEGRDGVSAPSGYNNFSEEYYLARNPDVAKAVNEGIIGSGWDHYVNWGKAEGRSFAEPAGYNDFNEVYYLANNPDVAKAVNSGDYGTGWQHYSEIGQSEGRSYAAPAPVNGAVLQSDALPETTIPYTGNVFTLYDNEVEVEGTPDVTAIYWGYTPHQYGPNDGDDVSRGIPVEDLLSFLTTITGLDLYELGLIDDDGLGPFDNVTSLSLSNPFTSTTEGDATNTDEVDADDESIAGGATNVQLVINYTDGTSMTFNAEALLGEQYFYFLQNLLFYTDEDGLLQSRLFERVVEEGTEGYTYLDPIILTPTINNGGTLEPGFTSAADDIIVAGRLELLHQAYIDAGAGYDILEVDAKGVFAQPLQLLNIEEIRVQNLNNAYTIRQEDGNTYPDLPDNMSGNSLSDSILDLSRATSLERLVITEGDYASGDKEVVPNLGELTIVGIRNGATARFEGGFSEDVTLHYGQGITGELDVELAIGDITADINLLHNAAVLNVDSQGIENHMHAFFAGGSISRMIITGTGAFGVEEDLSDSFNADRPAIIDASANTGGLDVTLNGHYKVNIKGTEAYDEITAENSGDVTIEAYNGDNVIDVDGSEIVDITSLGGADEISAENGLIVTIAAGAGADKIDVDGSESIYIDAGEGADEISAENGETVTILAGNGDNEIDVDGSQTVDIVSGGDADTITSVGSETVTVDSGAGDDDITASALVIDIDAGDGNDKVVVAGLGGETEGTTAGAVNLMLILDDSGSMSGQNLDDLKAAANDMLDQVADSGADAAAVTIIFGTSVTSSCWGTIEDARAVINALTASSGGTDYAAAINSAMTAFGQNGAISGAANLSIFISDGYPSPGVDSTLQGQWETFLNNNDIVSYAIGIGGLTDDTPLEPIAYDGVKGTDIDPILGTGADLTDILSEIAGTIGLAGNNALVNLDLGDGQNIVQLGDDADLAQGLVAQEGSSISGENITLKVKAASDLRAAELSGITKVVLEDDNGDSAPILTLTAEQFEAIGGANFSVEGSVFHTHAFVKIIVGFDQEVSLTDLGVDDLPRGIDLYIEIEDEARVTMTAEQLHTHVAQDGIVLVDDGNTDYVNGKVVITGGGSDFDPFNTSDTIKTIIDGTVYYGGSLSDDFMVDGRWYNVTVKSVVNGYDRPADEEADIYITLDSTGTETLILEPGGFSTWHWNLEIIGDQDIVFDGPFALGMELGEPANPFTVDFSELEGEVFNFTLDNFEMLAQGGGIYGNSDNGYESEVLIHIADDDSGDGVGFDEADADSLVSQGVQRYIVTQIDGPTAAGSDGNWATICLCDTSQDIEVFGLRGNWNDSLFIDGAAWGLAFELQGGTTAKADGPTGTANVGELYVDYEWDGADAVVGLVHSVEGDLRPIYAAGIDIDNADSITINAEGPAGVIEYISGNSVETLDLNAEGDLTIVDQLPKALESIDGTGVAGHLTLTIDDDIDGPFSLVAGTGGLTLTLDGWNSSEPADFSDFVIDGGAGGGTLIVDGNFDLTDAVLSNIDAVVLEDDATLWISMVDADLIGAADFSLAEDATNAELNLDGLDGEPFAVANYADGIDINLLRLIDADVTLNALTDLHQIDGLEVAEGRTLTLTAEQYQQLVGPGSLDWYETDGNPAAGGFEVVITDLTQAAVDYDENGDEVADGFDLSGIDEANITIILTEDITLTDAMNFGDDLENVTIILGDGMTLTLADVDQADGLNIIGGVGSTLQFNDTNGFLENIDASGFDVDYLRITNLLVSGNNVDYIFADLPERVTKVIFNGIGDVEGRLQTVVIEEGTTIFDDMSFNEYGLETEISYLTLNMEGGTELDGDLVLSTVNVNPGDIELVPYYLQELIINSTGTGENRITGETANIITGDITPAAYPPAVGVGSRDNQLKTVTINAAQDFVLEGDIIFLSHGDDDHLGNEPDDGISANDDNAATAVLNVTGEADVMLGDLEIDDNDVDALIVNHTGTGVLSFELDGGHVDEDDAITVNGGAGTTIARISDELDLSDDNIGGVDQLVLEEDAVLTLDIAQLIAIDYANISVIKENGDPADDTDPADNADLHIVGFGSTDTFDATQLDVNINVLSITLEPGDVVLDPSVDLTGVGQIIVQEGGSITLTADQFQQLADEGTIVGIDAGGNASTDFTVNITGLTDANISRDLDGDGYLDDDDGFDLSEVDADNITVTLGSDEVTLGEYVDGVLVAGSAADIADAEFILADNQTLSLANFDQADGLVVGGGSNTTLVYKFGSGGLPIGPAGQIDASGYDVTTLKALAAFFSTTHQYPEYYIDDLASTVELRLYEDPADLGFLDPTFRRVVIEEGITTPTGLVFNDWDPTDEVRTLTLTLEGDVTLNGSLSIPTRTNKDPDYGVQQFFSLLTINSLGDDPNMIAGNIDTAAASIPFNTSENNLLDIRVYAEQDLAVTGSVVFNSVMSVPTDDTAWFTISGDADVTVKALDTTDADIVTLNVVNSGTGTLTITGGSDSLELNNTEELVFTGTGDIVLDTDTGLGNNGIEGDELSLIDARGLSGDLTLGVIEDIDSDSFEFFSGTGVTTMTLTSDTLDSTGPDATPGTDDDGIGWNFDFTGAAVGSEIHLGNGLIFVDGSILNIDLGANTTLYIDASMDLSGLDLEIIQTLDIVLGDEVTLTLTAAQANALNIVKGEDTDDDGDFGIVNIVGLGDDPVDLSGIADDIAGFVYLEDDDVSLDAATDLGGFTVALIANDPADYNPGGGQTIRFSDNTDKQADGRDIIVVESPYVHGTDPDLWDVPGDDANRINSTNVAWLFDTIPGQLDTTGYDANIGRLWVSAALIDSVGGDVENLFNWLPDSILRVDFNSVTELDIALASYATDRVIELTSFTTIAGLTEIDDDILPQEEHIETLRIAMGGEVTVGNIVIGDVVAAPDTDPLTPEFEALYLNSRVALHDGHYLATEDYVNDNDGTDELGEHVQPAAVNTIGDIGVGGTNALIDLLDVNINTYGLAAPGTGAQTYGTYPVGSAFAGNDGADLVAGTLIFDSEVAGETATLVVTGANDVTFKSVDTSDSEITAYVLDTALHVGVYNVTGGSPAMDMDDTESFTIATGTYVANGVVNFGTAMDTVNNVPYAGVAGDDLSAITITGNGEVNLGVLAEIDGTDDLAEDINGDGDTLDLNEGANIAFLLDGNGNTTATLGEANVDGIVTSPLLEAGSTWRFEDVVLTISETTLPMFEAGATLELHNVELYIQGDVDLTMLLDDPLTPEEEGLDISGTTVIYVPEGQSLALTVEQLLEDDMVNILGAGTVKVVGDASNIDGDDLGGGRASITLDGHLYTVGVDISALTLIAAPDAGFDTDDTLELTLGDANIGTVAVPTWADRVITGSANDDFINLSYGWMGGFVTAGEGDDTINSYNTGATTTFIVDAGTDTINGIWTSDTDSIYDVLVVQSGAEAICNLAGGSSFIATAETINDGAATINAGIDVDVSLAGGANGFTLNGSISGNTLIGSQKADTINGGDDEYIGTRDILTGNGGNDLFEFNILITTPAELSSELVTQAVDEELIGVLAADTTDDDNEVITINYTMNNIVNAVVISDASMGYDIDMTSDAAVASAIQTALDGINGFSAEIDDGFDYQVNVVGDDGNKCSIDSIAVANDEGPMDIDTNDGADVLQESTLTVVGTATVGERYNLTVTMKDGTEIIADEYESAGGETEAQIAAAIATNFNAVAPAGTVNAVDNGDGTITLDDENADDGGFTVTNFSASGAFGGSGASGDPDPAADGLASADIITDFNQNGDDVISLGLAAGIGGVSGNIDFAAAQASYGDAYTAASGALGGNVIYFFTSIEADAAYAATADEVNEGDTVGLLFFDADNNGTPDGVIALIGVDGSMFAAGDIIA